MNRMKLNSLTKEQLVDSITALCDRKILSWEQIDEVLSGQIQESTVVVQIEPKTRLSQEYITENMKKTDDFFEKIENQELTMTAYWYEDYSDGYWNSRDVWEYEDPDGIIQMLIPIINLAQDSMNDCWYEEALSIYDRLLDLEIYANDGGDGVTVGLQELVAEELLKLDLTSICLNTLYCDYQVQDRTKRVEDIHTYFRYPLFQKIQIQDMFQVGRQQLDDENDFWNEWIQYLLVSENNTDSRLLKEAIEFCCDEQMVSDFAEKYYNSHPALYLYAIDACVRKRNVQKALQLSKSAMEKLDVQWRIRSEIAKKAAEIADSLDAVEEKNDYLYEAFRSDSNVKNFLYLFENRDLAEKYGMNCKDLLPVGGYSTNMELRMTYKEKDFNYLSQDTYNALLFLMGEFTATRQKCKNTTNSLGWSSSFIRKGLSLFLLYLYDGEYMGTETAIREIGGLYGRSEEMDGETFFEMLKKWKTYYPMEQAEREEILNWSEKIIEKRVEAIVGGQHRRQYGEVAKWLGALAEIRESWGEKGIKLNLREKYRKKYPRHSAFQGELNSYLGVLKK